MTHVVRWQRRPDAPEYRASLPDGVTLFVQPLGTGWGWAVAFHGRAIYHSPYPYPHLHQALRDARKAAAALVQPWTPDLPA